MGGPFAPPPPTTTSAASIVPPASGNASVASALVSSSQCPEPPTIPPWVVNRLAHLDLNHGPIADYFEHLAHENTARSRAILIKVDQVADALHLDDDLLDELLVGLGLEKSNNPLFRWPRPHGVIVKE
jgi:hypothetical protein